MTSFADLKTRIADELDRQDINSQIGNEIVRAVKHYERQRFWFNEAQATASTSSSQASYAVPSDLLVLDDLELTRTNGNKVHLKEIHWSRYLDEWRYSTNVSEPGYWTVYADQLWLGAIPNTVYTLTLNYLKRLTQLSADGDENDWTNEAEDLICSRTLAQLGSRLLHLPAQDIADYRFAEREAYLRLIEHTTQRTTLGWAQPWRAA